MPTFVLKFLRYLFFERVANRTPLADYPARLKTAGQKIEARISAADDSPKNRTQLAHIIGIERWGQSRLRTALGAGLTIDEYDGYRPNTDQSWAELKEVFATTRQETISMAQALVDAGVSTSITVPHNQFGDMAVRSWLQYLMGHAQFESKRIK